MLDIQTILLFFASALLLALAPGPDNLFVLAQSVMRGSRAGLLVTLGLCTGLLVRTTAVTLGGAVIFKTSALAFALLKYLGAAYLLYLAWQAFRAGANGNGGNGAPDLTPLQLYRRGIFMNVTNPKVSIFFLAFLPQFADPARGAVGTQMISLGGLFIVATLLVFGAVSLMAGYLGQRLHRSQRAERLLDRLAGTLFAALALKLATSQR